VITAQIPKNKHDELGTISFAIEEIRTSRIPKLRGILYFIGSFFKTLMLQRKSDIIHIQPLFPLGLIGIILGYFTKKPTAVWARGADIEDYSKFKFLITCVIRHATSVIALSSDQKMKMETLTGRKTIKIIPNGVWMPNNADQQIRSFSLYLKEFAPSLPSSHIINDLNVDIKVVLYVGRLEEFKGIQYLLRAIPITLKEIPNTLFLFV
jgi:glycosyltransferase involved in cell wall biosynthesis